MTPYEFEAILGKMSDNEFEEFKKTYGGDMDRGRYAQHFTMHPNLEARLCQILKVPTESENGGMVAEATLKAEQDQATEAHHANILANEANLLSHHANRIALWACIIAAFARAVSVVAILVSVYTP